MKVFKEFWRTAVIDGVENPRYMVSNFGKVKCLSWGKTGKERLCKLYVNSEGYLVVGIDGVVKRVHRIVAETFIPNNKEHKQCIDHTTTRKQDNIVLLDDDGKTILYSSIRWVSQRENCNNPLSIKNYSKNASKPMLGKLGDEHNRSVAIVQLTFDEKFIRKWGAAMESERELGINNGNIIRCCKGKLKSAGGYKWMYLSDFQKVCKRSISEIKPLF